MNSLVEQIIVDIINEEMQMPTGAVWIRDENRKFDNSGNLNIIVGVIGIQPFGARSYMVPNNDTDPPTQQELQQVVTQEMIQIDILSRNNDALFRRAEIVMALNSFYSLQQQEANSFKIFRIPVGFLNTSDAEGGSQLHRFSITINCHVWYRKLKNLPTYDYYDDFTQRGDDAQSIGTDEPIFEFEITPEGIT